MQFALQTKTTKKHELFTCSLGQVLGPLGHRLNDFGKHIFFFKKETAPKRCASEPFSVRGQNAISIRRPRQQGRAGTWERKDYWTLRQSVVLWKYASATGRRYNKKRDGAYSRRDIICTYNYNTKVINVSFAYVNVICTGNKVQSNKE